MAWWASRSLHILSRRWLVFTPAGLVLHDQFAVVEAVLVIRRHLATIGPALVGTDGPRPDASARRVWRSRSTSPSRCRSAPRRAGGSARRSEPVASEDVAALLFTPTRPGRVLAEAAERHLPTT